MFDRNSDSFPSRDTYWFRDWWRPLRTATGCGPQVMVRFLRLRHLGTGPRGFRLGRRVLYRADDLHEWITAQHDNDGPNLA